MKGQKSIGKTKVETIKYDKKTGLPMIDPQELCGDFREIQPDGTFKQGFGMIKSKIFLIEKAKKKLPNLLIHGHLEVHDLKGNRCADSYHVEHTLRHAMVDDVFSTSFVIGDPLGISGLKFAGLYKFPKSRTVYFVFRQNRSHKEVIRPGHLLVKRGAGIISMRIGKSKDFPSVLDKSHCKLIGTI